MATAMLRSHQDYFQRRLRRETVTPPPPPFIKSPARNPNPNYSNSLRRKQSPVPSQSKPQDVNRRRNHGSRTQQPQSTAVKVPAKDLVMGHVKILKRGETLSLALPADGVDNRLVLTENRKQRRWKPKQEGTERVLGSRNRVEPDRKSVEKQIRFKEFNNVVEESYAGSEFLASSSPPPSSLPIPGFLGKIRQ